MKYTDNYISMYVLIYWQQILFRNWGSYQIISQPTKNHILAILGVVFVVPVQAAVLSSCLWFKIMVEISPK